MARLVRSPRLRGVAVIVVAGVLLVSTAALAGAARSSPQLAPVSAERLVANVIHAVSANPPISGSMTAHFDIGLPDFPDEGPATPTGPAALIASFSGDHRLRVWHSRDGARLSDLLPTAERSIIVSQTQAWLWDSSSMTAVRLGAGADPAAAAAARKAASMIDPVQLAQQALAAIDPSTRVSVAGSTTIAGRDAYVLSLEPRTSATLVGRVELYVDASRWLPLGGAVFARGASSPALSARFTTVSFGSIDPAVYRFTPPQGAKVITPRGLVRGAAGNCPPPMECPTAPPAPPEGFVPPPPPVGSPSATQLGPGPAVSASDVRTFGSGWATVVAVPAPTLQQLQQATAGTGFGPVPRLLPFSGPLFSVNMAQRGDHAWLLFGAVPQSALQRAAADLP
jgi:outer membrane lipoprotein-sorting protein